MVPTIDRLMAKVTEDAGGCWIFGGSTSRGGYGQIRTGGHLESTHRVTFEYFLGAIPEGLVLDHLCRVRDCCNPWHLEPVTQRINILRGDGPLTAGIQNAAYQRAKTGCDNGHAFTETNTYITSQGNRQCRECKRLRMATYRRGSAA